MSIIESAGHQPVFKREQVIAEKSLSEIN